MKKQLLALALLAAGAVYAGEAGIIQGGDFENVPAMTEAQKASAKKNKMDTDVLFLIQPGWNGNSKIHKMRLISSKTNPDDAPFVHSGNCSLMMESKGGHFYFMNGIPVGKYTLEFYAKGKGAVRLITYLYGAYQKHLGQGPEFTRVVLNDKWQKVSVTADFGRDNPKARTFRIAFTFINEGKMYIDDITLRKADGETKENAK